MMFKLEEIIMVSTFIISLSVYFQKSSELYLKLYPVFLLTILGFEFREYILPPLNASRLSDILDVTEFCFTFFVLREIIHNLKVKRILLYLIFIGAVLGLLNLEYFQKEDELNTLNYLVGTFTAIFFCIYYYVELFREEYMGSLSKSPAFWIVTGFFFNNIASFPALTFFRYMDHMSRQLFYQLAYIFLVVTFFTSVLTSIGFLCRIRIRRSTL